MGVPPEHDPYTFPVDREVRAWQGSSSDHLHNMGKEDQKVNNPGARLRITELDIFRHMISMEDQALLMGKLRMLYLQGNSHPNLVYIPNLETLSQKCLGWITNEGHITQDTSIIALLTSHHFAIALQGHIDPALISHLQDFLFSTTLAYTFWRDHNPPSQRLSVHDLYRISHLTGSALLNKLDHVLQPQSLTRLPRSTLQALFLVIFGTTLGVAYSTSVGSGPPVIRTNLLSKVLRKSPTLWMAMKERLCHLLADDLIVIASILRFQFDPRVAKNNIIEGCLMGRWNRTGNWVWASARLPPWAPTWQQGYAAGGVDGPGSGMFLPAPQAMMIPCPEALSPILPAMDGSDGGKRRLMIVVGPSGDGQQMYARMRTHTGSDGPSLFV
ncbi:hypothetical protein VMCG_03242 [Cytospora schulzeri]|uniref:Uncharacterized protein n=1 Tax=Cytospora schulzeri TaxID=448051 RepID=A0A423WXV6_9PEZI|nr:hypothetical protein VMCG_03242 [Valsa malicola]